VSRRTLEQIAHDAVVGNRFAEPSRRQGNGGKAVAIAGDVRDEHLAKALVEAAVGRFDGLDAAFNNAGAVGQMGPVTEISLAGWQEALDVNLTGAFLGAKYQLAAMLERGGGSLIFTSSFVGNTVGFPGIRSEGRRGRSRAGDRR
jgi:NAD(P)-dependent dehydrogenase (short-subunit alcohol dehydrogenase family)